MKTLNRAAAVLALLFVLIPTALDAQTEASLGVTVREDTLVVVQPRQGTATLDAVVAATPQLYVAGADFELNASVGLEAGHPDGTPELGQLQYELGLSPLPILSLKLGRFFHSPGTAEFLSNSNLFMRIEPVSLLQGRLGDATVPAELAQATVYLGRFSVTATGSAFVHQPPLPDPDSPWFPQASVPQSIKTLPHLDPIPLAGISYADLAPAVPLSLDRLSYSVELGGYAGGVDFSALWYNGWDNTPLLTAELDLVSLTDPYFIVLRPVYRKRTTAALNARWVVDRFVVWTDNAYTFYKRFLTNRLDAQRLTTQTAEAPYLEHTFGASAELPWNVTLLSEYRLSWAFTDDEVIDPFLSRAVLALVQADLFDYRVATTFAGVVSVEDHSVGLFAELAYKPSIALEFVLGVSYFLGEGESELGQFGTSIPIRASLVWRF